MSQRTPWTPVALSMDIPVGSAAPGQLGPHDLAIWRSASGRLSVWADRCPHRGMRLSHGFVRGEALSCIYHGWRYAEGGQCIRIPAHPDLKPPAAIRVPAFSGAEVSGVIWAAEAGTEGTPPEYPGMTGFRSLQIETPAERLAARLADAPLKGAALVQPLRGGACRLHLLAPEGADCPALDALSAAAEALRRELEAREKTA
ncbi:MAG: Rieske 2Fe-2S domain-containing protein [Paracoccus sp. (in: a-proteobacteria)]|uniref:Rieske 2Fe-2S domain-containing protein n=1 Tax=Paracoccus sp. TaxID=267 RepID=UPI0039E27CAF